MIIELEETGEVNVILRRGQVVARLIPDQDDKTDDPEWCAAYKRMMREMRTGAHLGGLTVARDDLYER